MQPAATPKGPENKVPYDGDMLGRKALAENFTSLLAGLKNAPNGAVISIDAPWGAGKSWFCENWCDGLKGDGRFEVVKIDAFKHDYTADAFGLIFSHLMQFKALQSYKKQILNEVIEIFKATAPALAGATALVASGGFGALVASYWSKIIEKAVENKIARYAKKSSPVDEFRKQLEAAAQKSEKQLVVFVDELDRCRPAFAMQMLDSIKHFFGVKNVVFVLFVHMEQLAAAVEHVHGGNGGHDYLEKFIDFPLVLPRFALGSEIQFEAYRAMLLQALVDVGLITEDNLKQQQGGAFEAFVQPFVYAAANDKKLFPPRLFKKAAYLLLLSSLRHQKDTLAVLAWVIFLKLQHREIYELLKSTDQQKVYSGHEAAQKLRASLLKGSELRGGAPLALTGVIADTHKRDMGKSFYDVSPPHHPYSNSFFLILNSIDLPMAELVDSTSGA